MDTKGIIIWIGFAVICAVICLVSRRMKKEIEENGIETTGVISRITDEGGRMKLESGSRGMASLASFVHAVSGERITAV